MRAIPLMRVGPDGAAILFVSLDALRRGAEAARSDLAAERLAVLAALEPLQALPAEQQAALALGATVRGGRSRGPGVDYVPPARDGRRRAWAASNSRRLAWLPLPNAYLRVRVRHAFLRALASRADGLL